MQKSVVELMKSLVKVCELKNIADAVVSGGGPDIVKGVDCRYRKWTVFKLITHMLYVPLYTSIISKYFSEFYYVDLFSGSGLGYVSEEVLEDVVKNVDSVGLLRIAGSPLIPLSIVRKPFSGLYLNDLDPHKTNLLRKRIEAIARLTNSQKKSNCFPFPVNQNNIKIYNHDANIIVNKIMKDVEAKHETLMKKKGRGCHLYFFIDPSGLEFKRKSLERILRSSVRSDIVTLFNSYGAAMQVYNHIKYGYRDDVVRECLGDRYIDYVNSYARGKGKSMKDLNVRELSECLLNYYINIFNTYNYEVVTIRLSLIEPTIAKSKEQEREFDILLATKKTKRGNPYINAFIYIKNLVEKVAKDIGYSKVINAFIEYIATGRLPGLLGYIINNPNEFFNKYSTYKRYGLV